LGRVNPVNLYPVEWKNIPRGLSKRRTMRTIKDMPEHSRPREKLRERGASALTDKELVAAILGRGIAGVDIVTMSRSVAALIRKHKENLSVDHLTSVPGMGLAKAAQILSAFELARRYLLKDTVKITSAKDVLPLVADIADKKQEYFVCISLNGANEVNSSQIHPREVFADVIADRATAVIFAHNHPSGDPKPSETDAKTHRQLTEAGAILGLRILDHIIVTKKGYFSFQEAGLIA